MDITMWRSRRRSRPPYPGLERWSPEKIEHVAAGFLAALTELYETMSNSLTKPEYAASSESVNDETNVEILNALSSDLAVMRQSMVFGLLESVAYNLNRKNNNLKMFEFGNTYHKYEKGFVEDKHLSLVLTGNRTANYWNQENKTSGFFYLKGLIKSLLERLGIKELKYRKTDNDIFSEGLALYFKKNKIVEFGVVKASALKTFGIKQEVLYADFNWNNVIGNAGKQTVKITELPKYPEVKRDLALLLDEKVDFIDLYNFAFQSERKLLKQVDLFDVYVGDKLPEDKKSYALSFILQDENKTLNDVQIDKIMTKLQRGFENEFAAELR